MKAKETTAPAKTAADIYREKMASKDAPVIDVRVPSGLVFKFRKPSKYAILFAAGRLPTAATDEAAATWQKNGDIEKAEHSIDAEKLEREKMMLVRASLAARDRMLELSVEPKIVLGPASAPNEICALDIDDDDLDYLFKWVSSGGDTASMLKNFPRGLDTNTLASASRSKLRAKS